MTSYFNASCVAIPTDPSQPFGTRHATASARPGSGRWTCAQQAVGDLVRREARVRVEAFNLLNRTNFQAPNGNRSAAGFGTITATYDARQLQLGVKVLW